MLKFAVTRPVTNVVVFGCGGTGSRAVPLITQLLSSHEFTKNVKVMLVDGDVIEEKNTKRQLFMQSEVGKNKAEVLAKRYRLGFGAKVAAVPSFIPSVEHIAAARANLFTGISRGRVSNENTKAVGDFFDEFLRAFLDKDRPSDDPSWLGDGDRMTALQRMFANTTVFVSCVDSADARRRILEFIHTLALWSNASTEDLSNCVIIDAGNEDLFGQVSYFSPMQVSLCPFPDLLEEVPDRGPFSLRIPFVPMPLHKYMTMVDAETQRSCADMDQTLAVNSMMANLIFMVFQNLVYGLEMDFHTIYANMNGTFTTDRMSLKWMKGIMSDNQAYVRGIVDNLPIQGSKGYRPALSTLKGHWSTKEENSSELILNSYFSLYPWDVVDAVRHEGKIIRDSVGKQVFAWDSIRPSAHRVHTLFQQRQNHCHGTAGKEPLAAWIYTSATLVPWNEMLWPLIAKGLSSGFVKATDLIKNYAYLSASMSVSVTPLEGQNLRTADLPANILQGTLELPTRNIQDWLVKKYVFSSNVPYTMGDHTISDELSKDAFIKEMVLDLNLKDSVTGEDIKITLPSVNGSLFAMTKVTVRNHRVNENGVGTPSGALCWMGSAAAITCFAIMSSLTKKEIAGCQKWAMDKSNKNEDLLLRSPRSIMASARGYGLGGTGTSPNGVGGFGFSPESMKGSYMNVHTKYGDIPVLVGQYAENIRVGSSTIKEGDMLVFGKTVATSDICISPSARVYQKDELKILSDYAKEKGSVFNAVAIVA